MMGITAGWDEHGYILPSDILRGRDILSAAA